MEPWLATVELVDVLGEEPTCYDSAKRGHQKKEEVKASSPRGLHWWWRHRRGAMSDGQSVSTAARGPWWRCELWWGYGYAERYAGEAAQCGLGT